MQKSSGLNQPKWIAFTSLRPIIDFGAQFTGIQLKRVPKFLIVTRLTSPHVDCHTTFNLYPKSFITYLLIDQKD